MLGYIKELLKSSLMKPNQNPDENNTPGTVTSDGPPAIQPPSPPSAAQPTIQPEISTGLPSTQASLTLSNQAPIASPPVQNNAGVVVGSEMPVGPLPDPPKSKNRIKLVAATLLVGVILLVGLGAAAMFIGKESKQAESSEQNSSSKTKPDTASSSKNPETEAKSQQAAQNARSPLDAERIDDINAIHTQVEAYYNQTGSYPTLSELTDSSFRNTNLKGINEAILTDPAGTEIISSSATASRYGYAAPKTTSCPSGRVSVCNVYVLTAILSNGQSYTKQSLN